METHFRNKKMVMDDVFNAVSSPTIYCKSRRGSLCSGRKLEVSEDSDNKEANKTGEDDSISRVAVLSERRKALFEPLEPIKNMKFPPPDFESANYPKGWLKGKKRKLVNVDVVESMRRIAIQEMNRKDREIDGLNEQLDEDSRCLQHLQLQLVQERSKRAQVERENAMLQDQVNLLMNMLQENEQTGDQDKDQHQHQP